MKKHDCTLEDSALEMKMIFLSRVRHEEERAARSGNGPATRERTTFAIVLTEQQAVAAAAAAAEANVTTVRQPEHIARLRGSIGVDPMLVAG